MTALIHIHSLIAWTLLIFLVTSIITGMVRSRSGAPFKNPFRNIYLITLILTHIQVIFGFVLYFTSPKVMFSEMTMSTALYRFFTLEHPLLMIIAVVLVTIGYSKSRRAIEDRLKYKRIYIYYLIALILILLRFPWQYLSGIGRGWFA